jgi:GcrA cell cycle regulator
MSNAATYANPWTDERVELLKKLWLDGLSASQIAKKLGRVTRSAVIGKVHRLGLSGRATPSTPMRRPAAPRPARTPPTPRDRALRTSSVRAARMRAQAGPDASAPITPLIPDTPPGANAKPWIERVFRECARPVGGDGADTLSCCNPTPTMPR